MQVERPTFEILKELEILSDTEGKYIYHLASMYIRALGFLKLSERNIRAFLKSKGQTKKKEN